MIKELKRALTGVAQLVGCHPAKRKVNCLIPDHSACLGCVAGPSWATYNRQPIDASLLYWSFSLPPSLSLSLKINKMFFKKRGKDKKKGKNTRKIFIKTNFNLYCSSAKAQWNTDLSFKSKSLNKLSLYPKPSAGTALLFLLHGFTIH